MSVRSAIVHMLLGVSYHLGGPALNDAVRGGQVRLLMYHGIPRGERGDGIVNAHGYNVPLRVFERHVAYLVRHCHVVGLSDALSGDRLSRRKTNVILTFDDGYENTYVNAFAMLRRYGIPATFGLPTAFVCDREPLWNDVLEYAVQKSQKTRVSMAWDGREDVFSLEDRAARLLLYDWLMDHCLRITQSQRSALISSALAALGISVTSDELFQEADYRPLSAEQIREMAASGLAEFASHSVHHYALTNLGREEQGLELVASKHKVEELTGRPCTVFCVPAGIYDENVLEQIWSAGYQWVLTSDRGAADLRRRVLNRNCVYRERRLYTFADVTHGPVFEAMAAVRNRLDGTRARLVRLETEWTRA